MNEEKEEYPCEGCDEDFCETRGMWQSCYRWRMWFHRQWEEIRKLFGRNVSNRHEKKGEDDE